jgi:hypothetical protein
LAAYALAVVANGGFRRGGRNGLPAAQSLGQVGLYSGSSINVNSFAGNFGNLNVSGGYGSPTAIPTNLSPGGGSVNETRMGNAVNNLQNILDSDNEISEMGSRQLQMLTTDVSQLLRTASCMEKSILDSIMAITANIKQ